MHVGLTARHLSDSAHMYIVRTCILMYNTHTHTSMVHLLDYWGGGYSTESAIHNVHDCMTIVFSVKCPGIV